MCVLFVLVAGVLRFGFLVSDPIVIFSGAVWCCAVCFAQVEAEGDLQASRQARQQVHNDQVAALKAEVSGEGVCVCMRRCACGWGVVVWWVAGQLEVGGGGQGLQGSRGQVRSVRGWKRM